MVASLLWSVGSYETECSHLESMPFDRLSDFNQRWFCKELWVIATYFDDNVNCFEASFFPISFPSLLFIHRCRLCQFKPSICIQSPAHFFYSLPRLYCWNEIADMVISELLIFEPVVTILIISIMGEVLLFLNVSHFVILRNTLEIVSRLTKWIAATYKTLEQKTVRLCIAKNLFIQYLSSVKGYIAKNALPYE